MQDNNYQENQNIRRKAEPQRRAAQRNVSGATQRRAAAQGQPRQMQGQPQGQRQPRPMPMQNQGQPQGQRQPRPTQGQPQSQRQPRPMPIQNQGQPQGQRQPRPTQGQPQGQRQPRPMPVQNQGQPQGSRQPRSAQEQHYYSDMPYNYETQRVSAKAKSTSKQNKNAAVSGKKKKANKKSSTKRRAQAELTPQQKARKKRKKIIVFVSEIFLLLILLVVAVGVYWGGKQVNKIKYVEIPEDEIKIDEQVQQSTETGVMKGYRNVALFGVDSREGQLDKATRTDTIIIASINLDTKEVKMVSVYRDTWLNLSTDSYNKANSAYAKGGPKQAIAMLNMNLDMNITDFVTIGFDGLIDVIEAVGGVEIDVKEAEVVHLNSFQTSMAGKPDGTLNAAGEPNYVPDPSNPLYKYYKPVEHAGLQTLNGLQATAYCRIRYVGNDFERTQRQRTVIKQIAKKAITLNPNTLNAIAEAVFPKIATSLDLPEILSLLSGIASYEIGDNTGFPFDGHYEGCRVKGASVIAPADLEQNVVLLHQFLFGDTEEYTPSDTVKKCSQKIVSDTGVSASQ